MNGKGKTEVDKTEEVAEERSYYYDDAHGYEDFDPDLDEDCEDMDD